MSEPAPTSSPTLPEPGQKWVRLFRSYEILDVEDGTVTMRDQSHNSTVHTNMSTKPPEAYTSSLPRHLLGPFPCIFGHHNWGPPKPQPPDFLTSDEHAQKPDTTVTQHCRSCSRYRLRPDIDRDTLTNHA